MPSVDLLSFARSDVIESMMSQVLGDTSLGSYVDDAGKLLEDAVKYNEEQSKNAYSAVFEILRDQEGGGHQNWIPKMTGLHRTMAPPGKGPCMWVSLAGMEQFQMLGKDAIKKIGVDKHLASK